MQRDTSNADALPSQIFIPVFAVLGVLHFNPKYTI